MHMYSGESGHSASTKKMKRKKTDEGDLADEVGADHLTCLPCSCVRATGYKFDLIFNVPRNNAGGRQFEP